MIPAAVLTVSDSCHRGERQDLSGPAVSRELARHGIETVARLTVPDEKKTIEDALRSLAAQAPLVVTTGGTGLGPRDVTPEATRAVCDKLVEGVAEVMRAEGRRETPLAALSRALCGVTRDALILNLPGSPRGAVTSLAAVLPLLPHALALLAGELQQHQEPPLQPSRRSQE